MKNLKLIGFLMILASGLLFTQCTTDTIVGPAGADGIDGINGTNGTNGTDGTDGIGTASCVACHSESHRTPIEDSYLLSGHAAGGAVGYAGTRGSCAQCHSNEGFIDYVEGRPGVNNSNPTAISCTTCHSKHGTFDFENDGYDYALRTFSPVTLMTDAAVTIDLGDKSNLCINCHQPRRTGPSADENDEYKQTSSHWGPHHGPQSTLLEGIQGMEITGSETYPTPGSATHRSGSSCVACHMGGTTDGTDGAHTWKTSETSCLTCHGSVPSEVSGFASQMEELKVLLEAVVGWEYQYSVVRDGAGDPVLDVDGDLQFLDINGDITTSSSAYVIETDINGDDIKVPYTGVIHDGHPTTGFYGRGVYWPIGAAEAGWNYLLLEEDSSHGVHNPAYARALVTNSIESLQLP